jgi:hypothetical protein
MDKDPLLTVILIGQLFIDAFAFLVAIVWYSKGYLGFGRAKTFIRFTL